MSSESARAPAIQIEPSRSPSDDTHATVEELKTHTRCDRDPVERSAAQKTRDTHRKPAQRSRAAFSTEPREDALCFFSAQSARLSGHTQSRERGRVRTFFWLPDEERRKTRDERGSSLARFLFVFFSRDAARSRGRVGGAPGLSARLRVVEMPVGRGRAPGAAAPGERARLGGALSPGTRFRKRAGTRDLAPSPPKPTVSISTCARRSFFIEKGF